VFQATPYNSLQTAFGLIRGYGNRLVRWCLQYTSRPRLFEAYKDSSKSADAETASDLYNDYELLSICACYLLVFLLSAWQRTTSDSALMIATTVYDTAVWHRAVRITLNCGQTQSRLGREYTDRTLPSLKPDSTDLCKTIRGHSLKRT
jgi:hypothetical protein